MRLNSIVRLYSITKHTPRVKLHTYVVSKLGKMKFFVSL